MHKGTYEVFFITFFKTSRCLLIDNGAPLITVDFLNNFYLLKCSHKILEVFNQLKIGTCK